MSGGFNTQRESSRQRNSSTYQSINYNTVLNEINSMIENPPVPNLRSDYKRDSARGILKNAINNNLLLTSPSVN